MIRRLFDHLTYATLSGRRRLRRYVIAALVITILAGLLFIWSQEQAPAVAGNIPPMLPSIPVPITQIPPTRTAAPAHAPISSKAAPAAETCPTDPRQWEFLEIVPDDNFRRIAPGCVYQGLAQTVAWELLHQSMGYSAPESAHLLGFADLPRSPVAEIIGLTNRSGPQPIALLHSSDQPGVYPPGFHLWQVDPDGQPGLVYTLRGCYRAPALSDDQVGRPGNPYRVICVASLDQAEWLVMEFAGQQYTAHIAPRRLFQLFGYAGESRWVAIGVMKDTAVQIGAGAVQVARMVEEPETIQRDREITASSHGIVPWDAAWLKANYGFAMRTLPAGWQEHTDPQEFQAIQSAVRAFEEAQP